MEKNVIVQQRALHTIQSNQWNTGIFEVFDDINTCCYAYWCLPCFQCTTAKKAGENTCVPLFDWVSVGVLALVGLPLCIPPISLAMRVAVRKKYGIEGSICHDCPVITFFACCSWTQISREIDIRSKAVVYITNHPQAIVPQGGVMVAQPEVITSQPGLIVPQPGAMVSQVSGQPQAIVPQGRVMVAQPEVAASQPGLIVPQPGPMVSQVSGQPQAIVPQGGVMVAQPEVAASQPGLIVPQPGPIVSQVSGQPQAIVPQGRFMVSQAEVVASQPGLIAPQPGAMVSQPKVISVQPEIILPPSYIPHEIINKNMPPHPQ